MIRKAIIKAIHWVRHILFGWTSRNRLFYVTERRAYRVKYGKLPRPEKGRYCFAKSANGAKRYLRKVGTAC